MCGIVGYIGNQDATEIVFEGLRRLEYRGYDSAGIALLDRRNGGHASSPASVPGNDLGYGPVRSNGKLNGNGFQLEIRRSAGKLANLGKVLADQPAHGSVGIGHTRWATHGKPTTSNAHP